MIKTKSKQHPNLNDLSEIERKELLKKTYNSTSFFEQLFGKEQIHFKCKKFSELFRNEIERLLLKKKIIKYLVPLEKLHESLSDEMRAYNFDDGINKVTTYFYDTDERFIDIYYQFINFIQTHVLNEQFFFQATPTIRIHCPNGENSHHYPRYHTDIGYGHPPEEINIWLPLTYISTGHGFRIMSLTSSKQIMEDFEFDVPKLINHAIHKNEFTQYCTNMSNPVNTDFGNMLIFDSRCIHSAVPLTLHTRVSIDLRILPLSQYEKMDIEYQGSGRKKILFTPGHCYHENDSNNIIKRNLNNEQQSASFKTHSGNKTPL